MSSLAEVQHLNGFLDLYKQHIVQLMEWVSLSHDNWTCYSPELLQLDIIATHSGMTCNVTASPRIFNLTDAIDSNYSVFCSIKETLEKQDKLAHTELFADCFQLVG